MHQFLTFILFWNNTLLVSDRLSVHHQEFKTVHTATVIRQILLPACQRSPVTNITVTWKFASYIGTYRVPDKTDKSLVKRGAAVLRCCKIHTLEKLCSKVAVPKPHNILQSNHRSLAPPPKASSPQGAVLPSFNLTH